MNENLQFNILDSGIRFRLDSDTATILNLSSYKFGFEESGFGKSVYYRTYSRMKPDGLQETWPDTVIRVIQGMFTIRKWWYNIHGLNWCEDKMQKIARNMSISMLKMQWLPPGRGLWAMGTPYVYERGSMSLYNCAFVEVRDIVEDNCWLMTALMNGVGVGFGIPTDATNEEFDNVFIGHETHIVGDSREGWVESIRVLLKSFVIKGGPTVEFDYSEVRPYGTQIKGFGGTASGPAPLIQLHKRLEKYCIDYISNGNRTLLVANIANAIGCCVVAGNVRRSAEICLGSPEDITFINLKNYEEYPDRVGVGWMSNNTNRFTKSDHFLKIPDIAESILTRGEPAIANMINVQNYGRLRLGEYMEDKATGFNPCSEIPLENKEVCNLAEVFPTNCQNEEEFFNALRYATVYASTVSLYPTSSVETNRIVAKNRRIGISLSGIADWFDAGDYAWCVRMLREGYKVVRDCNKITNEEAGIPPSVRVTTVKPSGTISQVVGVTPGMHHATYEYARRRMIIDKSHPLSKLLIEAEYEHEPLIDFVKDPEGREIMEQYVNHSACAGRTPVANETSLVFTYPIHQGGSRPASRVSAWEQFTQLAMLQREWSDNSVSCTIYFDKETEGPQISQMLAQFSPLIKSVSMLPHNDDAYLQMPYEKIDKEEYEMLVKNLKPIDWDNYAGVDSQQELYCSNDTCEIKTSS